MYIHKCMAGWQSLNHLHYRPTWKFTEEQSQCQGQGNQFFIRQEELKNICKPANFGVGAITSTIEVKQSLFNEALSQGRQSMCPIIREKHLNV